MKLNEIKINGVYRVTLKVQLRTETEIVEVDLFVRVVGKTSTGNVEVVLLNSPEAVMYFLEPHQLENIS